MSMYKCPLFRRGSWMSLLRPLITHRPVSKSTQKPRALRWSMPSRAGPGASTPVKAKAPPSSPMKAGTVMRPTLREASPLAKVRSTW
eukprot:346068-Alexandrium_andersonii.AAC.1